MREKPFIFLGGLMIGLFLSFLLYLLFTNNSILHADKFKDEKNMTNDVTDSFSSLEENLPEEEIFQNSISSFEDSNDIDVHPVQYFENIADSNNESTIKDGFIKIVDFIFYGTEINGYTFDSLTEEARLKIMQVALSIDSKIDEYFPGYKQTISSKTKDIYYNLKASVVELYLDTVSKICSNNESLCQHAREDFQFMKDSFGITWDFIKGLAGSGIDKLREWYEIFRSE